MMPDFDRGPERCVFEATLSCNLRCRHCGSRAGAPRPDELSAHEVQQLLDQLIEVGCHKIVVMGGEALMRPDWVEIVGGAARRDMRVGLLTNGLLFDREAANRAAGVGLSALGLSVDGVGELHDRIRGRFGVFEGVLRAMAAADAAAIPFSVVTQVNTWNLRELRRIHDFVVESGAFAWQVQIGERIGNMADHADFAIAPADVIRLSRELGALISLGRIHVAVADSIGYFGPEEPILRKDRKVSSFGGCQAGLSVVGVESNGDVKGCLALLPGVGSGGEDFVEGNIRRERLAEIWQRRDAFAYNRSFHVDDLEGFCRTCAHVSRCRGGCRGMMLAAGHGVENPYCAHRVLAESYATRPFRRPAAAIVAAALTTAVFGCGDETKTDAHQSMDASADSGDGTDEDTSTETEIDTETATESDVEADAGADTETDTEPPVTVYEFCMDTPRGRTGLPISGRCGGDSCVRQWIRALQSLKGPKGPKWPNAAG